MSSEEKESKNKNPNRKPLTSHWADQTAARLISQRGDRDSYVVASGITPSGVVHIGNFREVIAVDLVARALRDIGKNVRFIYSWDNFDTFRKVPKNLPQQELLATHLRKPIVHVPDVFGKQESYARANEVSFENELSCIGIQPEYIYQAKRYSSGHYAKEIRFALERVEEIKAILNEHRTSDLDESWLPTNIYCEACDSDEMHYEKYDGEWNYSYHCASCDHKATTDIRTTKNLKLGWRVDWPMRWAFEKVDFEPGGKDHSSQGGSYDTGKQISQKIWQHEPPVYLQYDFVSIKGLTGKMSSSSGVLITLTEAYEVYTPQMIRWIFANQRTNHDFSIAFDEDVIKTYDEFDRSEVQAFATADYSDPKRGLIRRTYELSLVVGKMPEKIPYRPGFRVLCNRLQICDGDFKRTLDKFYKHEIKSDSDRVSFMERSTRAWNWLEKHAPEEFKYKVRREKIDLDLSDSQKKAMQAMRTLVECIDLEAIDPKDLNQKIYDDVVRSAGCDPKEFFKAVYQSLIGRDQGPRLPSFLKEIGKDRLLGLL